MWSVLAGLIEQPVHGAQYLAVQNIIYHPRYQPRGLDYDIALMKLNTSLVFNGTDNPYQMFSSLKLDSIDIKVQYLRCETMTYLWNSTCFIIQLNQILCIFL